MEEKRSRKLRSDKKIDCKPFVSISFYDSLDNVSRITERPIKDVGESILIQGLSDINIIEHFEEQFVFDYWHGDTVFMGDGQKNSKKRVVMTYEKRRLNMRFTSEQYFQLKQFANSLDRSIANAAARILEVAFFQSNAVHRYIETHVVYKLDQEQRMRLREVLQYINSSSPDVDPNTIYYGLFELVSKLKRGAGDVKSAIGSFLDKYYS